ncbi:MAG TPA: squalene synthase HpnC [Pirellulaceae bacterium]|jgi:squalene synthase HpnC
MDLQSELARFGPAADFRPVSVVDAQAYCRRLAESHYENFTVVSRLFPRRLYQHLCNVYAYCRWADDLADESTREQAIELLDWWQRELDAVYAGESRHPVFVALRETIQQFMLPREPLADLLTAFRRDQAQQRYETLDELLSYCDKSANPVGRIVLFLGNSASDENIQLSDSICTGLQLANFWQDVKRDYDNGRIYIPREFCQVRGWNEAQFAAGQCDDAFRELLAPLVATAERQIEAGSELIRRVNRDLRLPIRVFAAGGRAVLAAIRKNRYDVWSHRPTVGRLLKLRILASAVVQSAWWQ